MRNTSSPAAAIYVFSLLLTLIIFGTSAIGISRPLIFLNENQILYLFSTSAQVIAAIYGLTLTGFIFFRNELSREELEDETLAEAVEALKARYFTLLIFITGLVGLTLLLSNLAISFESTANPGVNAVIINSGQSAFLTSLAAIAYFIFDVISPQRVARASRALQSRLDPSAQRAMKGSLERFVRNYNEIERLLGNAAPLAQDSESRGRDGRLRRHVPNGRLAEVLFRNERIDKSLFDRLRNLISLRNSIIHGADPVVSEDIVRASEEALRDLQTAVERNRGV